MQATRADIVAWQALIAASAQLTPMTALNVHLAVNNFTPGLDILLASFSEATFNGYASIAANPCVSYFDPVTGLYMLQLPGAPGGYTWTAAALPWTPQTVYGYYVTDHLNTTLIGCDLLEAPVLVQNPGDGLSLELIRFGINAISGFVPTDS